MRHLLETSVDDIVVHREHQHGFESALEECFQVGGRFAVDVALGASGARMDLGFQAWRATFDSILLTRATELGVNVYQPCQVLKPIINGNRVEGVETTAGSFKASFVIDATGSQRWLTRQMKLPIENYSPQLIARYGYAEGSCPIRDDAPAVVADNGGWTWTAKVD